MVVPIQMRSVGLHTLPAGLNLCCAALSRSRRWQGYSHLCLLQTSQNFCQAMCQVITHQMAWILLIAQIDTHINRNYCETSSWARHLLVVKTSFNHQLLVKAALSDWSVRLKPIADLWWLLIHSKSVWADSFLGTTDQQVISSNTYSEMHGPDPSDQTCVLRIAQVWLLYSGMLNVLKLFAIWSNRNWDFVAKQDCQPVSFIASRRQAYLKQASVESWTDRFECISIFTASVVVIERDLPLISRMYAICLTLMRLLIFPCRQMKGPRKDSVRLKENIPDWRSPCNFNTFSKLSLADCVPSLESLAAILQTSEAFLGSCRPEWSSLVNACWIAEDKIGRRNFARGLTNLWHNAAAPALLLQGGPVSVRPCCQSSKLTWGKIDSNFILSVRDANSNTAKSCN